MNAVSESVSKNGSGSYSYSKNWGEIDTGITGATVKVPVVNHTIPHQTTARYGGADIFLRPATHGTGVIAGGTVRMVVEAAGIKDILSKSKGSSNPHNVVKATFKALLDIRRPEEVARMRGISLSKVFNG